MRNKTDFTPGDLVIETYNTGGCCSLTVVIAERNHGRIPMLRVFRTNRSLEHIMQFKISGVLLERDTIEWTPEVK